MLVESLCYSYYAVMLNNGLIQIYTGQGKGKTTAAFGLAFRASGAGLNVLIYQFLKPKSLELSERVAIENCGLNIDLEILDISWNMCTSLEDPVVCEQTRIEIEKACKRIGDYAASRKYDLIIMDEIVYAHHKSLVSTAQLKELIANRDEHVEIVMTGRGASEELIELADLVSQIEPIKHPYQKGIDARKGIEF